MKQVFAWIRSNLPVVLLSLFVIYLLLSRQNFSSPISSLTMESSIISPQAKMAYSPIANDNFAPNAGQDRMVVKDTSLSLQVKSVNQGVETIEKTAVSAGGYMVNSNLNVPEGAASGSITIRIPEAKRTEVLAALKALAVKTVSEYVQGTDVTDQYQNLEEQLRLITVSKSKFEEIQRQAIRVQDILEVQRELINLQSQIDSIRGQQKYLEQTSKLTRITIYLSTDEFALPYTPDQPWRPEVIFKQAVRSLVSSVRVVGTAIIWAVVYAPIWATILVVYWLIRHKTK